jgi:PEP-CTERM motif
MRQMVFATASIVMLFAVSHIAEAGQISYLIQNYLADQHGASLSGTITTDGVNGNLADADILSWTWTITGSGEPPVTVSSSDIGASAVLEGAVVASQSSITIALPTQVHSENFLLLIGAGPTSPFLNYERGLIPTPNNLYSASTFGTDVWVNHNPVMGGTDPWVIAAASAVPEPSSLALAGLGAASGIAVGLMRKRRTKGTNDPTCELTTFQHSRHIPSHKARRCRQG